MCSEWLAVLDRRTDFVAPMLDLLPDLVANCADFLEFFLAGVGDGGRVGKSPVQSLGGAGEDRTFLGAAFIANGDDVGEELAGFKDVKNSLGFFPGDIDADFAHHLHGERIERARRETGTLSFESVAADVIEERFRHLAAGTVMHANEEHFLFHSQGILARAEQLGRAIGFRHTNVTKDRRREIVTELQPFVT